MSVLKRMRKTISLLVMLAISFSLTNNIGVAEAQATVTDDLKGHWAETNLREWIEDGLLQGYNDGSYKPDKAITRAELIALTNRAFDLTEKADIAFKDLTRTYWAFDQVAAAVKAEYVKGYEDGTIRPNQQISREEASSMVASLLKLEPGEADGIEQFKDAAAIASWSKPAVAALVKEKIINGYTTGNFGPKDKLTRAQAVTLLVNALAAAKPAVTYDKPGVYGPENGTETIKANVIVTTPGVTLRNLMIEGNLTIASSVGEGDAFFKKVTVKGKTSIQGGGANSIHFEDSVLVRITVNKKDGTVRVVAAGTTTIQYVLVESPVKLEESLVTDSGFGNIELAHALPSGSQVQLTGVFENVNVLATNIKVSIPSGSVQQLTVSSNSSNNEVNLGKDASIQQLILDAITKLIGQGKVEKATVNNGASGSSFETKPGQAIGDAAGSITIPPISGGVIGGGGNNGSGSDGGNNGGNNGGESNVCAQENAPLECKDSSLVNVAIEGFTLKQLNSEFYETDSGFKPNVYAYSIINSLEAPSIRVPITVTKSAYVQVNYHIANAIDNMYETIPLPNESNTFYVDINPKEDLSINFSVLSGDKVRMKMYTIYIHYPRTIQEASSIERNSSFNVDEYGNNSSNKNYRLKMLNGKKLLSTDIIELYQVEADHPFKTCTVSNTCSLLEEHLPQLTGTINVKVIRNEQLLESGSYQYDIRPITRITDDIGVSVERLTTQGLIDAFNEEPWLEIPLSHAFTANIDLQKLKQILPEAEYYNTSSETIPYSISDYPLAPVMDMLRTNATPFYFDNSKRFISPNRLYLNRDEQVLGSYYYHQTNSPFIKTEVKDVLFYVYFYDEDFNIIGYYATPIAFDEEHLADGLTPLHTWNPIID